MTPGGRRFPSSGFADRPIPISHPFQPRWFDMSAFDLSQSAAESTCCEYCVHVLSDAVPTRDGIVYRRGDGEALLAWSQVRFAIAATVGEPEGVSTIVFDLLVERTEDRIVVYRFDADPGAEAIPMAVTLEGVLGPDRSAASLKAMASEGSPFEWFPDLESFEAAAAEILAKH